MGHRDKPHLLISRQYSYFDAKAFFNLVMAATICSLFIGVNAQADVVPRLNLGLYYNDNVALAPQGQEQEAYISEIQPGIRWVHDGPRLNANLDYSMQALYFSGESDKDEINHIAYADMQVVAIPQRLFVDASASYSQQFISPDGTIDLDNLSSSENSTDVLAYRLSPFVQQQYGSFANAEYRVELAKVDYQDSAVITEANSTSTTGSIEVSNGLAFDEFFWRVYVFQTRLAADNAEDSELQSAEIDSRYRITPKFEILANIGYEDNDYQVTGAGEEPVGEYWSAGFSWSPGRRTQLQLTHGQRFFGETTFLLFSHRTRRSVWNVQYSEQITTTPQWQGSISESLTDADDEDTEGPVVPPPPSELFLIRTSSVMIVERLTISLSFQTAKSLVDFSLYDENRIFQDLGQDEETAGVNISWNWRFLPRTTSQLSATRYRIEYQETGQTDYLGQIELSVERRMRRHVVGAVGARVLDRNSSTSINEYERSLAFVTLGVEF